MGRLDGKVAVVTGGNRGIGRAIVEALAAEGATVALTSREAATAETAAREVGGGTRGFACDVRHEEQVGRLFEEVARALGGCDILVNNAGVGLFGPVAETRPEDWR
ncbi:MAG: SDR family NAD(P)-dependent oxidoreductase, partial [Candidatus Eisenbacteria bacterium]